MCCDTSHLSGADDVTFANEWAALQQLESAESRLVEMSRQLADAVESKGESELWGQLATAQGPASQINQNKEELQSRKAETADRLCVSPEPRVSSVEGERAAEQASLLSEMENLRRVMTNDSGEPHTAAAATTQVRI